MYRLGPLILLLGCTPMHVHHGSSSVLTLEKQRLSVYVPVEIEGTIRWFFLDSGYSHTTCDDELAAELGLDNRGTVWVRGMMGRVQAWRGLLPPLALGEHRVEDLLCTVRDLRTTSSVQAPPGEQLAGVLGVDVLDHFTWTLDTAGRALTLAPPEEACPEGSSARLRGGARRRKLRVRLDGGVPRNFLVDTGSNRTLAGPAATRDLVGRTEETRVRATGSSEPSVREVTRYEVAELMVDELPLGEVTVTSLPDGAQLAGLLGLDVLRQAPSCFDAQRHRWTLYPTP